jgi:small redox-active disulfide protein 2
MTKIEVLGTGCPKCQSTEQNVTKALAELKVQAEVVKVTEIDDILARGVMFTPALVIDGKVVLQGKIPTVDQIKQLVKGS